MTQIMMNNRLLTTNVILKCVLFVTITSIFTNQGVKALSLSLSVTTRSVEDLRSKDNGTELHENSEDETANLLDFEDIHAFQFTFDDAEFYHPVYRPMNVMPEERHVINTRFDLYTRDQPRGEHHQLKVNCTKCIESSAFRPDKKTKFIVHGWLDNKSNAKWMLDLTEQLLLLDDFNVVIVDWREGNRILYTQAVANARVVGAEIALLVENLQKATGLDPKSCHIIGHSLGAHIAGYAGKRIKSLGRITGLDPASLFFENMPPTVRLDRSDALFVDVIHTDISHLLFLGLGMHQPVGHVDFYPNGGRLQPGCLRASYISFNLDERHEVARRIVSCDHQRAIDFFISTVITTAKNDPRTCYPVAFKCSSWDYFRRGRCIRCGSEGEKCAIMGWRADEYKFDYYNRNLDKSIQMFLITGDQRPYCAYHYEVFVLIGASDNFEAVEGRLSLHFILNDTVMTVPLSKSDQLLYPGSIQRYIIAMEVNVFDIDSVWIIWNYAYKFFNLFRASSPINVQAVGFNVLGLEITKNLKDDDSIKWYCPPGVNLSSGDPVGLEIHSENRGLFTHFQSCQKHKEVVLLDSE